MEPKRHTFTGQLEEWRREMLNLQTLHRTAAERLRRMNYWLGVPVIVLSAVVSSSIFATLGEQVDTPSKVAVGLLGVTTAVLSGLQTFFKFSERAEQHRAAAVGFTDVQGRIDARLASPRGPDFNLQKHLDDIQERISNVEKQAHPWLGGAKAPQRTRDRLVNRRSQTLHLTGLAITVSQGSSSPKPVRQVSVRDRRLRISRGVPTYG